MKKNTRGRPCSDMSSVRAAAQDRAGESRPIASVPRGIFRLVLAISILGMAKVALQVTMPWRRRR